MKPSDYTLYRAQLGLAVQAPTNRRRRRRLTRFRLVRIREHYPAILIIALFIGIAAFTSILFL